MANEQLIDQVITPQAEEQVVNLTKLLSELDIQMASNIKNANNLNVAVLNSKSFTDYSANTVKATLALEKIQQAQNKTAETSIKLEATQKRIAEAESARIAKLEQQRQAADAKEIAAAEAKATKLAAIQRKSRDFPASQTPYNPVTAEPDSVMPFPTGGTSQVSAGLAAQIEAKNADAAASETQAAALAQLDVAYKENIELLNQLTLERKANSAAMKELDVTTAAGAEQLTLLTANELQLKTQIAGVTLELNRQTKEMLAAEGSMTELDASVLLLRTSYEQLSIAERESTEGQAMLAKLTALDAENKKLAVSTGNTAKEVGAYEKAIAKATDGTQLAATAVNVATRSIIRMVVQFALFGVVLEAAEWLYKYVAALDIFNPIADAATRAQKGLTEAFASNDFQKGIENIETLATDFNLLKKGLVDQDTVINKYNETLGKTFGYVDNINDAQKRFIDQKDDYIKAIIEEAAAQNIAAEAAKQVSDIAVKNQKLREDQKTLNDPNKSVSQFLLVQKYSGQGADAIQKEIASNNKRIDEIIKKSIEAMTDIGGQKKPGTGKTGTDAVGDELTTRMNAELERLKAIAQAKINNDKLSYKERLAAEEEFYSLSKRIEENNERNSLSKLTATDARRKDIAAQGKTKLTELEIQHNATIEKLRDEHNKNLQQINKNNIEKERDVFKAVLDDPTQSYDTKLNALKFYGDRSKQLIDQQYDNQLKAAGKNADKLKLSAQEYDKSIRELEMSQANERLKIYKEEYDKVSELSKMSEQEQIEILEDGSNKALNALDRAKNNKLDALNQEREDGKISEKKYQKDLFDINHAYNLQRIAQEIQTQQTLLAIQEGTRDSTALKMKGEGISQIDIDKYVSGANKGIGATKNKLAGLQLDYQDENSKTAPNKRADQTKQIQQAIYDATVQGIDSVDQLQQKAHEAQIARLEEQARLIDENADVQKNIINNSIASEKTKNRQIQLLDAQTASQKKAILVAENKEKNKAAVEDKIATIGKIIAGGALAFVQALSAPPPLDLILPPIIAAASAVQLATAIAAPLPKYKDGGKWQPGLGLWGEAGMERANLPDGSVKFSTGPEVTSFPLGTVITPHLELMQQLKPAPINYAGGEQIGWGEVVKQLKKMDNSKGRGVIRVNVDGSFEKYKRNYLTR